MTRRYIILIPLIFSFTFGSEVSEEMFTINNLWILIASFLVFIMHLGFASLESGLTRSKNTVNILFKNLGVVSIFQFEGDWPYSL